MRTILWGRSAWLGLLGVCALGSGCASDDTNGDAGSGGASATGGHPATGGTVATGGTGVGAHATGGSPFTGGTPSTGAREGGSQQDAGADSSDGSPTTGVDASSDGGPDAGPDGAPEGGSGAHPPYPACNAPVVQGDSESALFPAGHYDLRVITVGSYDGVDYTGCHYSEGTVSIDIDFQVFTDCRGDACVLDEQNQLVANVTSSNVNVGPLLHPGVAFSSEYVFVTDGTLTNPLPLETRNLSGPSVSLTIDRRTGAITAYGTYSSSTLSRTTWSGAGSLACADAPANTRPFPRPRLPAGPGCDSPIDPGEGKLPCDFFRFPTETCAEAPTHCDGPLFRIASCTDIPGSSGPSSSDGYSLVCCSTSVTNPGP